VTFSSKAEVGSVGPVRGRAGLQLMGKSTTQRTKILYAEGDAEVLAEQAVNIEKAGHHVTLAEGRKQVEEALRNDAFDLVVLGPTLTKNDRHHLPYMVKKYEGTRVLVMHTDGERHPYVDANLDTGRSIEALLEKIAAIQTKEAVAR